MDGGSVAVLIPCYNEVYTVGSVIRDFAHYIPYARIYVGDNGSTDGSFGKVKSYMDSYCVECRRILQKGRGNVLRTLFEEVDADIYLIVDADGSYHAVDAISLVNGIRMGRDLMVGSRLSSDDFSRKFFNATGNRIVRRFVGKPCDIAGIQDVMTGYMALSRHFVKSCHFESQGFDIAPEIIKVAASVIPDEKIGSACIRYTIRQQGTVSKFGFADWFRVIESVIAFQ